MSQMFHRFSCGILWVEEHRASVPMSYIVDQPNSYPCALSTNPQHRLTPGMAILTRHALIPKLPDSTTTV